MQLNLVPLRIIATSIAFAVLAGLTFPGGLMADTNGPRASGGVSSADKSTSVRGVVWNADDSPLPHAKVRLRNLQTGRVDAAAAANENGQFAFASLEVGSYVIELLDDNDKVIAVGQSFRLERGETVATFVRLGTRDGALRPFLKHSNRRHRGGIERRGDGGRVAGSPRQPAVKT